MVEALSMLILPRKIVSHILLNRCSLLFYSGIIEISEVADQALSVLHV